MPNNFGKPLHGEQDLRNEKGSIWFNTFFSTSQNLPSALLNRAKADESSLDIIDPQVRFDDKIDAILASDPKVGMTLACVKDGDNYNAEVHIEFKKTVPEALTLTLMVVEDKIYTTQESRTAEGIIEIENYEQNHVLREVATDAWGIDVVADGNQGTKRMIILPVSSSTFAGLNDPSATHILSSILYTATVLPSSSTEDMGSMAFILPKYDT